MKKRKTRPQTTDETTLLLQAYETLTQEFSMYEPSNRLLERIQKRAEQLLPYKKPHVEFGSYGIVLGVRV